MSSELQALLGALTGNWMQQCQPRQVVKGVVRYLAEKGQGLRQELIQIDNVTQKENQEHIKLSATNFTLSTELGESQKQLADARKLVETLEKNVSDQTTEIRKNDARMQELVQKKAERAAHKAQVEKDIKATDTSRGKWADKKIKPLHPSQKPAPEDFQLVLKAATQVDDITMWSNVTDDMVTMASELCREMGARNVGYKELGVFEIRTKLAARAWPEVLQLDEDSPKTENMKTAEMMKRRYEAISAQKRAREEQETEDEETKTDDENSRRVRTRVNPEQDPLQPQASDVATPQATQRTR